MQTFWFMAIVVLPLTLAMTFVFPPALFALPVLGVAAWIRARRRREASETVAHEYAPPVRSEAGLITRIPGLPLDARLLAIERLGLIGGEDSLALLDELSATPIGHEGIKAAAERAARSVRSRLEARQSVISARAGELSLHAPGEEGALALAGRAASADDTDSTEGGSEHPDRGPQRSGA